MYLDPLGFDNIKQAGPKALAYSREEEKGMGGAGHEGGRREVQGGG